MKNLWENLNKVLAIIPTPIHNAHSFVEKVHYNDEKILVVQTVSDLL
jgi:hypothetical protein